MVKTYLCTGAIDGDEHICSQKMLFFFNTSSDQTGPADPGAVTPRLLLGGLFNTTKNNLGKLQQVQNRAARLALKCTQRANINHMHDQLHWLKVHVRLKASLLSFIKKH